MNSVAQGLNWRRGLLRSWLFLTATWILLGGIWLFPSDYKAWADDPWRTMAREEYQGCASRLTKESAIVDKREPLHIVKEQPATSSPKPWACDPIIISIDECNLRMPGPWCEYYTASGRKLDDVAKEYSQNTMHNFICHLLVVLGLPLLCLAAMSGLMWVARGFKR